MPDSPSEEEIKRRLILNFHTYILDFVFEELGYDGMEGLKVTEQAMQDAIRDVQRNLDPEGQERLANVVEDVEQGLNDLRQEMD